MAGPEVRTEGCYSTSPSVGKIADVTLPATGYSVFLSPWFHAVSRAKVIVSRYRTRSDSKRSVGTVASNSTSRAPRSGAHGLADAAVASSWLSSHSAREASHIRRPHCDHVTDCAKVASQLSSPCFRRSRSRLSRSMSSQQADTRIPAAASHWTKDTLQHLNAIYVKEDCADFAFDNLFIPSELREGLTLFNISNFRNRHHRYRT